VPLSGRNSTYRPVQILEACSIHRRPDPKGGESTAWPVSAKFNLLRLRSWADMRWHCGALYLSALLGTLGLLDTPLFAATITCSRTAIAQVLSKQAELLDTFGQLFNVPFKDDQLNHAEKVCEEVAKPEETIEACNFVTSAVRTAKGEQNDGSRIDLVFAGSYYNRGAAYLKLEQYDRAAGEYSTFLTLTPTISDPKTKAALQLSTIPAAYRRRARAYYNLQEYDKSLDDLDQAIRSLVTAVQSPCVRDSMKQQFYASEEIRGDNYMGLKQYEAAIKHYEKYLEIFPQSNEAITNKIALAKTHLDQRNPNPSPSPPPLLPGQPDDACKMYPNLC
jgi:tetratricopeptide (TPR) repeat protein